MEPQPVLEPSLASAVVCPRCGSQHRQCKIGTTDAGKQRYRCHDCRRRYVLQPHTNAYPQQTRHQALRLYLEGCGFRRIARLLRVNHQTVVNWIRAEEAARPTAPLPATTDILERDEVYVVHQKKGSGCSSPPR